MRFKSLPILLFSLCLIGFSGQAQIEDGRLWTGITLKHKFTRKISASISEQCRFDHNVSEVDQLFTEAGIEYEFVKNLKVSINYRFIKKNEFSYYSSSHRMFVDLAYKIKTSKLNFTIRERLHDQYSSINSSENGKIPEWMVRSKLSISYNTEDRYKPYVSIEFFNLIDNAKEKGEGLSVMRYSLGFDYEFNRVHSLDFGVIYQDDLFDNVQNLIGSIGYTYTF